LVLKRKLKLTVDKISEQFVYDKKMLRNHKAVNKRRRKLSNQQLQMDNHTEVIKQRLAAKTVIKNYNEINSTRFEYFKEKAGETKK